MTATILEILNTILPVFLVAGTGFVLSRLVFDRIPDPSAGSAGGGAPAVSHAVRRALHVLAFHVAGPLYVFDALRTSDTSIDALGMPAVMALAMYGILTLVAFGIAAIGRWDSGGRRAAVLALASKNCGNYGLPIVLFAFGDDGLVIGTVFMITHVLVHMTLGLSIASWSREHSLGKRLASALRFPYVYAIGLALLLRALAVPMPDSIGRAVALIGQMWMPLMLVLLGAELANVRLAHVWRASSALAAVKLLLPPAVALGLSWLLGLDGITRSVLILQASMPTAVNGLLVARQFDARPDLVASTLMLSTLGSVLTISILLGLLA